mmetsp:Transcript_18223/g.51504  ORF Transcript_18223/g.51504 Transcript_18223/m.51504 type:complete len:239 (+) Transcript_18223:2116-2832(+)
MVVEAAVGRGPVQLREALVLVLQRGQLHEGRAGPGQQHLDRHGLAHLPQGLAAVRPPRREDADLVGDDVGGHERGRDPHERLREHPVPVRRDGQLLVGLRELREPRDQLAVEDPEGPADVVLHRLQVAGHHGQERVQAALLLQVGRQPDPAGDALTGLVGALVQRDAVGHVPHGPEHGVHRDPLVLPLQGLVDSPQLRLRAQARRHVDHSRARLARLHHLHRKVLAVHLSCIPRPLGL